MMSTEHEASRTKHERNGILTTRFSSRQTQFFEDSALELASATVKEGPLSTSDVGLLLAVYCLAQLSVLCGNMRSPVFGSLPFLIGSALAVGYFVRRELSWARGASLGIAVVSGVALQQWSLPSVEDLRGIQLTAATADGRVSEWLLEGRVRERPRRPEHGTRRLLVEGRLARHGVDVEGKILVTLPDLPWVQVAEEAVGAFVSGTVSLRRDDLLSPHASPFSWEGSLLRQGIIAQVSTGELQVMRRSDRGWSLEAWTASVVERFDSSDAISVLVASALGRQDLLSAGEEELFRATGTTHLIVVSGFHIGICYLLCAGATRKVLSRSTWLIVRWPVQRAAAAMGFLLSAVYAALVGYQVPILRALIFLGLRTGAVLTDRCGTPDRALLLSAFLLVILQPGSFLDPSFQLTFAALLGLITASEVEKYLQLPHRHFLVRKVLALGVSCITVYLFTAPWILFWFHEISLLAPVANFFLIPLFTVITIALGGVALLCDLLGILGANALMSLTLGGTELLMRGLACLRAGGEAMGVGLWKFSATSAWELGIFILFVNIGFLRSGLGLQLFGKAANNRSFAVKPFGGDTF